MGTSNCWKSGCLSGRCDGVNHVMPPELGIVQDREDGSPVAPQNGAEHATRIEAVRYFRTKWDPTLQIHTFDEQFADWVVGKFRQGSVVQHAEMVREWKRLVGLRR